MVSIFHGYFFPIRILNSQNSFRSRAYPETRFPEMLFPLHKPLSEQPQNEARATDYRIVVLYTRPQYGKAVEFLSMYHVRETKDENFLKHTFLEAFRRAHPQWTIKEITVEMNDTANFSKNEAYQFRVVLNEKFPMLH